MPETPAVAAWRNAIRSEDGPSAPTTRLVLINLSFWMDAYGEGASPSQRIQAQETGLDRRSVGRQLREAERTGWVIRREHPKLEDGTRPPTSYFLPDRFVSQGTECPLDQGTESPLNRSKERDDNYSGDRVSPGRPPMRVPPESWNVEDWMQRNRDRDLTRSDLREASA